MRAWRVACWSVLLLASTLGCSEAAESTDEGTVYDWKEQQYQFEVMNPSRIEGLVSLPLHVKFVEDGN